MRRIEQPDLVDHRDLVYRVAPGGRIEGVVDGCFVYGLDEDPIEAVDHARGTVKLLRKPVDEVRLLVQRAS